jgi:hypothetical protein
MPKCAGTSLLSTLRGDFKERLFEDYGDIIADMSSAAEQHRIQSHRSRQKEIKIGKFNYDIVHGHFHARKYYGHIDNPVWVTILRDPLRLLPSYHAYLARLGRDTPPVRIAKAVPLDEFVEIQWFQNIMSRLVWPLTLDDFATVGAVEEYAQSLAALSKVLGRPIGESVKNTNPDGSNYEISADLRKKILYYNDRDVELYRKAVERLKNQKSITISYT